MLKNPSRFLITLATASLFGNPAFAASGNWTGNTSSTWQVNGNWSGASFPNGSGETATFNGAGNGNTNITLGGGAITLANFGVNGIVFDTSNVAAYSIANGTINTLQGGNIVRLNASVTNNQSVTANIVTDSQNVLYTTENILNYSPVANLTLGNLTVLSAASGTGSTTYSFRGLGHITVAGAITDNLSGGAPRLTAVANLRAGTLVLSGANAFSGALNGGDTPQSLVGGFGGTIVLDYTGGNAVLSNGTSVSPGRAANGNLVVKGNTTGTTSLTLNGTQRFATGYTMITVDNNGGNGTTLVLGRTWQAWNSSGSGRMAHFDLSSGGQVQIASPGTFTGGGYRVDRGIIADTTAARRSVATVKGTDGKTYFATLDGSGFVVAQTTLTTLPSGSGAAGFSSNLAISNNTTRTANLDFLTIRIEGASANQTLNMGGFALNGGGAILMDGANDFTISNYSNLTPSSGVIVMGDGKLTLNGTRSSANDFDKFGPGLLEVTGNHSGSTGATFVWGGTYRASSANALTAGNLVMADSVLELGYNFTRALGTGTGQVQGRRDDSGSGDNTLAASFGFSAYGGDRTVNLGGASGNITFGSGGFVASRDAKFLLSSTTSDSMVDFQNPLNLNNDVQTIEVRNGSAAVDARLSGILSNGSLNKTGAGTLELTATNTYSGGTVISAGTVVAANSSALGNGTVTVAGGTLATTVVNINTGSLNVSSGAFSLNGASTGTITLSTGADLVLTGGTWNLSIAGPGSFDSIIGGGTGSMFSISGATLNLSGTIADGSYAILTNFADGGSHTFSSFTGLAVDQTAFTSFAGGTLTLVVVPEPHEYALMMVGLLGLVIVMRRVRRNASTA